MSKSTEATEATEATPTPLPDTKPPVAAPKTMSLQTWCEVKSHQLGRRIEILSGFFSAMQRANVNNLTQAEWEARFQRFRTAPIGKGV